MKLPSLPNTVAAPLAAFALSANLLLVPVGPATTPVALAADGESIKYKFPPIDKSNKDRCKWSSSAMGQANAARDSLYDLRECAMSGTTAAGFDISGALLANGDFTKIDFKEAQLSKVYAPGAKFDGSDFTNGIIDRAYFSGASFRGAIFKNAVLSGSTFEDADLTDADFTDAYIGSFDQKKLCKNPKLTGDAAGQDGVPTRVSAGCPP